jgi:hypothetical protein
MKNSGYSLDSLAPHFFFFPPPVGFGVKSWEEEGAFKGFEGKVSPEINHDPD